MATRIPIDPFEAYAKGFNDGTHCRTNTTTSILGYELNQLLNIIRDWESRQPKVLFESVDRRVRVEQSPVSDKLVVWADGVEIFTKGE